jgi:hypothetical protein
VNHHHLVAKADGGTDDECNLITLCFSRHGYELGALVDFLDVTPEARQVRRRSRTFVPAFRRW